MSKPDIFSKYSSLHSFKISMEGDRFSVPALTDLTQYCRKVVSYANQN